MAILKIKEIRKMGKEIRNKKLGELKLELIKSKAASSKGGSSKIKQTKKIIARILTLNKSDMLKEKSLVASKAVKPTRKKEELKKLK